MSGAWSASSSSTRGSRILSELMFQVASFTAGTVAVRPPRVRGSPLPMDGPPSLYAAFDRFPAPKGAAVHIDRFARTLFAAFGGGLLYVLGDERLPAAQREPGGVEIVRFGAPAPTALERGLAFGRRLGALLRER